MKLSSVIVVIACTFLIRVTIIGSDFMFYHSAPPQLAFGFFASQMIVYLLYPLLGWVSDVYFTRYNVLRLAFIIFIAGSAISTLVTSVGLWENLCHLKRQKQ